MTPTDLAAALLRDVPRFNVTVGDHTDPSVLLLETDVLAALSVALDPALTERAGEVLEALRFSCLVSAPGHSAATVSDLITALLAQIAALRAERDAADGALVDRYRDPKTGVFKFPTDVAAIVRRLDAAEAKVEKLRGALEKIAGRPDYRLPKPQDIARAALTTEADNG